MNIMKYIFLHTVGIDASQKVLLEPHVVKTFTDFIIGGKELFSPGTKR
jgi:hypothetical protein